MLVSYGIIRHIMSFYTFIQLLESIRDCFMTGEWKDDKNAESLLKLDDEDEDIYGDFEDLETGQKFSTPSSEVKKEGKSEEDGVDESKKFF